MVITPSTYKYQSIWSQATNIKFLIFFLLVRKWNKDTDTIAYKICLKKHFFFFLVCVSNDSPKDQDNI